MIRNETLMVDLTNGRDVDMIAITVFINGTALPRTIYVKFRTDRDVPIIDLTDGVNSK